MCVSHFSFCPYSLKHRYGVSNRARIYYILCVCVWCAHYLHIQTEFWVKFDNECKSNATNTSTSSAFLLEMDGRNGYGFLIKYHRNISHTNHIYFLWMMMMMMTTEEDPSSPKTNEPTNYTSANLEFFNLVLFVWFENVGMCASHESHIWNFFARFVGYRVRYGKSERERDKTAQINLAEYLTRCAIESWQH